MVVVPLAVGHIVCTNDAPDSWEVRWFKPGEKRPALCCMTGPRAKVVEYAEEWGRQLNADAVLLAARG